jgi:hypothetical protein
MSPAFLIFGSLHLAGLLVRDAYELLKKAGRLDTRDARVFAGVFTAMCSLWVGWFGMAVTDPTRLPVPPALQAGSTRGSGVRCLPASFSGSWAGASSKALSRA